MQKLAAIAERAVQICATLAIFTFFVSGVAYMYLGRWKVTHTDYWAIYDICLNHTWLESALLKFNNHSLFFPSFLWLANLRFFHGDQQPLFFAGLTLLSITALLTKSVCLSGHDFGSQTEAIPVQIPSTEPAKP